MSSDNETSISSSTSLGDFQELTIGNDAEKLPTGKSDSSDNTSGDGFQDKVLPIDPFDSEKSRILFDAISKLQSWGSHQFLNIPQLVVVGDQSAGKSSLLRRLTDIPFPENDGCCTRFPIRVVSRRTESGSSEHYRISVERPREGVPGLRSADAKAYEYLQEGTTLTMDKFTAALDDLSENYIGIRSGTGFDKKNIVPDVVKIELSGPDRSPFSILDLPGIVSSHASVTELEVVGTHGLAAQYITQPENIIIYALSAPTDMNAQVSYGVLKKNVVDKSRLIGVFTKCDGVEKHEIHKITSLANGEDEATRDFFPGGLFVVSNKSRSATPDVDEQRVFALESWLSIPAARRGIPSLKNHLGHVLASEISKTFPKLINNIQSQLRDRAEQKARLRELCRNHNQKQAYVLSYAREYSRKATMALLRPGLLESDAMDLRQRVRNLNDQFGEMMRVAGRVYYFQDENVQPLHVISQYHATFNDTAISKSTKTDRIKEILQVTVTVTEDEGGKGLLPAIAAYKEHKQVKSVLDLGAVIKSHVEKFGASMPPGVINSDIYPLIYRLQVSKWEHIAQEHLRRVQSAMRDSFEAILESVCSKKGDTSILHNELKKRLNTMFANTFQKARNDLEKYCKEETERELLVVTDPSFSEELDYWRFLRHLRAFHGEDGEADMNSADRIWGKWDQSRDRMTLDIHDVVKIYYEISLKAFIIHVTKNIVESFVMDKQGPLSGVKDDYVITLSTEEIEEMAREDNLTKERREKLVSDIEKLNGALQIALEASDKVEG